MSGIARLARFELVAPGLHADVEKIKRIEQLERELAESNEYARKLNLKISDLAREREEARVAMHAALARSGSLAHQFDDQLHRIALLSAAGDRLFEELDDKTPEPNCSCHLFPPCTDCERHASSREAMKEWKEVNR